MRWRARQSRLDERQARRSASHHVVAICRPPHLPRGLPALQAGLRRPRRCRRHQLCRRRCHRRRQVVRVSACACESPWTGRRPSLLSGTNGRSGFTRSSNVGGAARRGRRGGPSSGRVRGNARSSGTRHTSSRRALRRHRARRCRRAFWTVRRTAFSFQQAVPPAFSRHFGTRIFCVAAAKRAGHSAQARGLPLAGERSAALRRTRRGQNRFTALMTRARRRGALQLVAQQLDKGGELVSHTVLQACSRVACTLQPHSAALVHLVARLGDGAAPRKGRCCAPKGRQPPAAGHTQCGDTHATPREQLRCAAPTQPRQLQLPLPLLLLRRPHRCRQGDPQVAETSQPIQHRTPCRQREPRRLLRHAPRGRQPLQLAVAGGAHHTAAQAQEHDPTGVLP